MCVCARMLLPWQWVGSPAPSAWVAIPQKPACPLSILSYPLSPAWGRQQHQRNVCSTTGLVRREKSEAVEGPMSSTPLVAKAHTLPRYAHPPARYIHEVRRASTWIARFGHRRERGWHVQDTPLAAIYRLFRIANIFKPLNGWSRPTNTTTITHSNVSAHVLSAVVCTRQNVAPGFYSRLSLPNTHTAKHDRRLPAIRPASPLAQTNPQRASLTSSSSSPGPIFGSESTTPS